MEADVSSQEDSMASIEINKVLFKKFLIMMIYESPDCSFLPHGNIDTKIIIEYFNFSIAMLVFVSMFLCGKKANK
jgi:hypothetical protein